MIRKKKLFVRPKKAYETSRIQEENLLVKKYGLKNKKEIWKTTAKVNYFRTRAKSLANLSQEEQNVFLNKLKLIGLKTNSLEDVLALKVEDLLDRRLSTIIASKKLSKTTKHARQLIIHKKVLISHKVVNTPSYIVAVEEEHLIKIKPSNKKVSEEIPAEKMEEN